VSFEARGGGDAYNFFFYFVFFVFEFRVCHDIRPYSLTTRLRSDLGSVKR
jgi:hypothetical protein